MSKFKSNEMTIDTALKAVDAAVARVLNDNDQRFPEAASVGDAVRQGDIYIQKIDDISGERPMFYKKLGNPKFPFQLAPGNTKGSRHMLEAAEGLTVYGLNVGDIPAGMEDDFNAVRDSLKALEEEVLKKSQELSGETPEEARNWSSKTRKVVDQLSDALAFSGPIFNLTKETKISHPEHGDWILGAGTYRVVFQRTVDTNLHIRRVLD